MRDRLVDERFESKTMMQIVSPSFPVLSSSKSPPFSFIAPDIVAHRFAHVSAPRAPSPTGHPDRNDNAGRISPRDGRVISLAIPDTSIRLRRSFMSNIIGHRNKSPVSFAHAPYIFRTRRSPATVCVGGKSSYGRSCFDRDLPVLRRPFSIVLILPIHFFSPRVSVHDTAVGNPSPAMSTEPQPMNPGTLQAQHLRILAYFHPQTARPGRSVAEPLIVCFEFKGPHRILEPCHSPNTAGRGLLSNLGRSPRDSQLCDRAVYFLVRSPTATVEQVRSRV